MFKLTKVLRQMQRSNSGGKKKAELVITTQVSRGIQQFYCNRVFYENVPRVSRQRSVSKSYPVKSQNLTMYSNIKTTTITRD